MLRSVHAGAALLLLTLLLLPSTSAACETKTILVQGRVEHAPAGASVTVELIYEHGLVGESDRLELEGASFRTRIPFSTTSHSTEILGRPIGKCSRVPKSVAVVLLEGDREVDRVTLAVPRDFFVADATELAVKSAVVLHGAPSGSPQK